MTMPRSGAWILLVSLAAPAAGQDAGDFGPLLGLIEPGDDMRVLSEPFVWSPASRVSPGVAIKNARSYS